MRILIISQWFDPEPADVKGLPFARELVRRGHEVAVITGFPNYPGGKIYPGYRLRLRQIEYRDGVKVIRVPLYPSHGTNKFGRILNYASFAMSASIIGLASAGRADVIYVYHPPATVAIPAIIARLAWRTPWVIDIQDMWPDAISASGMIGNPWILKCITVFSNIVNGLADRVIVLSPGYCTELVARGLPQKKIEIIYNWSRLDGAAFVRNSLDETEAARMHGRFVVLFAGNMGPAQALDSVIEAARQLQGNPSILFVFVGGGIDTARLERAATGLLNVAFLPRRHPSAMHAMFDRADALIVHLRDNPHYARTIPSKIQDYLAAGRPVVLAVRGDAAVLVDAARAGLVCRPEQPNELAAAVQSLSELSISDRKAMGACGKRYYDEHLSLRIGVTKFETVFSLLKSHPVPGGASSAI